MFPYIRENGSQSNNFIYNFMQTRIVFYDDKLLHYYVIGYGFNSTFLCVTGKAIVSSIVLSLTFSF